MTQTRGLRLLDRLRDLPDPREVVRHLGRSVSSAGLLPGPGEEVPGWAVVSAALVPVVLTAAWLVADSVQPRSYSPIRDTVSVLAGLSGTDRWIMTCGLFLICLFYLLTAAGLAGIGVPARILLIVAGVCSAGIATSPEPPSGPTTTHLTWVVIGAITIAIWPAVAGWRLPERPLVLSVWSSTVVTLMFIALLGWVLLETRGGKDLGLAERLDSGVQTCWPFVVALVLRHGARDRQDEAAADPADRAHAEASDDDDWPSDTTCRC
jgi:hypothetical membrane protein